MKLRILLIDDDPDILQVNKKYLTTVGFEADTAISPEKALELLKSQKYNCIVLDIRMDGMNGYDLCSYIKTTADTPIIFLTSLVDENALIKGFSCGADDYMVKPYSLRELEARIRIRIRSRQKEPGLNLAFGNLVLDFTQKRAAIGQTPVNLTINEFEILYFLASHKGEPFTQDELYQYIWKENSLYNSHSIQTMILRIRKKLKQAAPDREYIKTRWGKGYMFTDI